ncbi:DeoR family transcriptional regulator [Acetobacteraceae bacterium KSS12]|uniref:DeoR family transcriptional regulator n=1 Tax=Rhizosaccharibacter radicis TaxID=2782605 RepID=A0ABT1VZR6_9PROT|nr:DeoR family transcriptional regulator [Acetobacteraceae bacterium KSS12]
MARVGTLRLTDAAQALSVSSMTLRRDLATGDAVLELLGGHVMARQGKGSPYSLAGEEDVHVAAKAAAGRQAAALVEDGDAIFVDCGTTMPHLLAALPTELELTVVCYALNVATLASRRPHTRLFMLGGLFHPSSATFLSEEAMEGLKRLGIAKAFISAGGLHPERGASCANFNEVPVKQAVMAQAMRSFLLIDSSKLGQVKPAFFAPADAFKRVITEQG